MKKIGLVTGQLGHGGAEKQVVLLAQGLKRNGLYEPVVFCLSHFVEPHGKQLSKELITWYEVPGNVSNWLQKALWLCKQVRATNVSLLYGFLNVGNVYVAIAGLINRLPFICSIRNADASLPWWLRIPSRWSCNRADFVVANSESCARSLKTDLGVRHARLGIIGNGLHYLSGDKDAGERVRMEWGVPRHSLIIGTVSNLKKQKNPLYFIEMFKALASLSTNPALYGIWVGDGLERYKVESAIASLNSDLRNRILFPGARSDIHNVLEAFDIFVLTSSYEGLPNALMEAMASGLPCVATNVPGTSDILTSANTGEEIGFLVSPSNPQEFAQTLLKLLNDPVRMKKMGLSAQKHIFSHYSLEKMVLAHCDVFDKILAYRQGKE